MSERYEKLYALPANLYAEGSPIIVSAGNLLKDTQTGRVLAQLKLKNLSPKTVKAARLVISALDTRGLPLDSETEKEFLDLSVRQAEEFGQKTAIPLPDPSTRGFAVKATQVIFTDNSTWDGTDGAWEPLPDGEALAEKLGDPELLKQYALKFGGKCEAAPLAHKDLWRCACGTWNREPKCCDCGKMKSVLLNLDLAALSAEKDARLAKEKAEREAREAADKAAREAEEAAAAARAKKTKKILAIVLPVVAVLVAVLLILTRVVIPNNKYSAAKALLEAGEYEEAITAFEALNGYKDSAEQIAAAKEAKIEEEHAAAYAQAEALLAAGDYDGAIDAFKALGDYKDSAEKAKLARAEKTERENAAAYADAEALLNAGDFRAAYQAFQKLGKYQDSPERADAILQEHPALAFLGAKKGDVIIFGAYEQDNDLSNGKEPIEWMVLEAEEDKVLVISKYALDNMPYNESSADVTWDSCTLRKWLNGTFVDSAFSRKEKASILTVTVKAAGNSFKGSKVKAGKDTQDKVFLLSEDEYKEYFKTKSAAVCEPTVYTRSKYVYMEKGKCMWWLRVPGETQHFAAFVYPSGNWWYNGHLVDSLDIGVRPALWINLGA